MNLPHKPPDRLCRKRQSIWWWILYLDTCFSITLGRPVGVSAIGDCPPVESLTLDSSEMFAVFARFTLLCRQILATEDLSNPNIDHFTELLLEFLFSLPPSLHFSPEWLASSSRRPDWPINVQAIAICIQVNTYLVLLNRQWQHEKSKSVVIPGRRLLHASPGARELDSSRNDGHSVAYFRVITSCRAILQAFNYLKQFAPEALSNLSIAQAAYNAALILAIHMAETKEYEQDTMILRDTYMTFEAMADRDHQFGRPAGLPEKIRQSLRSFLTGNHGDDAGGSGSGNILKEQILGGFGMTLAEDPGLLDHVPTAGEFCPLDWKMADVGYTHVSQSSIELEEMERVSSKPQRMEDADQASDQGQMAAVSEAPKKWKTLPSKPQASTKRRQREASRCPSVDEGETNEPRRKSIKKRKHTSPSSQQRNSPRTISDLTSLESSGHQTTQSAKPSPKRVRKKDTTTSEPSHEISDEAISIFKSGPSSHQLPQSLSEQNQLVLPTAAVNFDYYNLHPVFEKNEESLQNLQSNLVHSELLPRLYNNVIDSAAHNPYDLITLQQHQEQSYPFTIATFQQSLLQQQQAQQGQTQQLTTPIHLRHLFTGDHANHQPSTSQFAPPILSSSSSSSSSISASTTIPYAMTENAVIMTAAEHQHLMQLLGPLQLQPQQEGKGEGKEDDEEEDESQWSSIMQIPSSSTW